MTDKYLRNFSQTSYVTAKPLDGTMMKVKLSEKAQARSKA